MGFLSDVGPPVSLPCFTAEAAEPLTEAEEDEELETHELLAVQLQGMQLQHQLLCPQHQAVQQGASLYGHCAQLHLHRQRTSQGGGRRDCGWGRGWQKGRRD